LEAVKACGFYGRFRFNISAENKGEPQHIGGITDRLEIAKANIRALLKLQISNRY